MNFDPFPAQLSVYLLYLYGVKSVTILCHVYLKETFQYLNKNRTLLKKELENMMTFNMRSILSIFLSIKCCIIFLLKQLHLLNLDDIRGVSLKSSLCLTLDFYVFTVTHCTEIKCK